MEEWQSSLERLDQWSRLAYADAQVRELEASDIAERLADGSMATENAASLIRFARYEAVWNEVIEQEPELRMFDGAQTDKLVEEFRNYEHERFEIAAQEIAARHSSRMPTGGAGEMGVIRREIAKKRRHLPLRRLIEQAGTAIQQIKPIFLMSPLSVAQYLPPGRIEFDILLIDEASQVKPEDALGSVARCKQIVVVGDSKQLPPTSFFDRLTTDSEAEADDDDTIRTGDMESILSLCEARGMPNETLRWHYRSKHPSLIEVSNFEFYDHRLFLPPSPFRSGEGFGLSIHHVNGIYDRGGSRTNRIEAEAIVDAVNPAEASRCAFLVAIIGKTHRKAAP